MTNWLPNFWFPFNSWNYIGIRLASLGGSDLIVYLASPQDLLWKWKMIKITNKLIFRNKISRGASYPSNSNPFLLCAPKPNIYTFQLSWCVYWRFSSVSGRIYRCLWINRLRFAFQFGFWTSESELKLAARMVPSLKFHPFLLRNYKSNVVSWSTDRLPTFAPYLLGSLRAIDLSRKFLNVQTD